MNKVLGVLRGYALATAIVLQFTFFPACYIVWILLLQPIKYFNHKLFVLIEGYIYENCILIASSWTDLAGHQVLETGDDISDMLLENCVLMANHQRPSDIALLMRGLQSKDGFYRRNMWIMDWLLQFLTFGWISKAHGDFFLLQPVDAQRLSKVFGDLLTKDSQASTVLLQNKVLRNFYDKSFSSVIMFPEGGFLEKRKPGSDRYADKIGHPRLQHVALPRSGAFEAVVKCLLKAEDNKKLWIIDVTLGYPQPITAAQYLFRFLHPKQNFVLHYKAFCANELFQEGVTLQNAQKFLLKRFSEKNEMLATFYKTGRFPDSNAPTPVPPLPTFNYLIILSMMLCSTYVLLKVFLIIFS